MWDDIAEGAAFHDWALETGLCDNSEDAFDEYGYYLESPDSYPEFQEAYYGNDDRDDDCDEDEEDD